MGKPPGAPWKLLEQVPPEVDYLNYHIYMLILLNII